MGRRPAWRLIERRGVNFTEVDRMITQYKRRTRLQGDVYTREIPLLELCCAGFEVVVEAIMAAIKIAAVMNLAIEFSNLY